MPLIFNYGPQSGWERNTGGTNSFLMDGGPLFHQFCLKSLHSGVGREAGLGLKDWPDGQGPLQVRLPCLWMRGFFLAYEWGDFCLWMRVILQAWEGAEFCCRVQGAPWPRAADNPPKSRRCSARNSIWLQWAQKAEGTSRSRLCDGRPNSDRLRILASGDDPTICGWRGSPNSVIL